MAKVKLTEQQLSAVEDRGGALLVSAAAGSGKTKVLVDRLFRYVTEERCNIDDFLIITYTKAAAAELRSKIASELSKRLGQTPGDQQLRRQLLRVYQADIKTVDAFCTSLLRENTHLLAREGDSRALTPDFRVLDDNEAQLIRQRVLSRTLEDFYDQLDQGRALLADTLGAGRDDSRLAALVLELYDKVQSHADPAGWLAENRTVWGGWEGGFDDTPYAAELLAAIRRKGAHWGALLRSASARTEGDEALYRGYGEKFLQVSVGFDALAQVQTWEVARQTEAAVTFPRLSTPRGRKDEPGIAALKQVWERCKAEEKKLAGLLSVSEEEAMEDLTAVAPAMVALLELTEDFAERYRQEKLRLNAADFSDQEHLALGLLVGSGGAPTELGEQVAARYREILVDEYQDTNEIQNAIFQAVSKNGQNIFTVGDVKQSIYRFRLADPTIFLGKYNRFKSWQEAADGEERKILLSRNFRSRREILESTNFIFSNILSVEMGEMDYGEDEALHFGAAYYPERMDCQTEFHLISAHQKAGENDKPVKKVTAEARFVAARIRKLLDEGYPVTESDGTLRPCRPEDIVILMRSPGSRSAAFAAALAERDIPCSFQESGDFFHTMEISVMLSLLEIVDNPRQDVPLICVLRSPVFGFTPDRLAQVRGRDLAGDFYDAVCADGGEDCQSFLAMLTDLRRASRDMSVHQLVWYIYDRLNVLGVFGAMDDGPQRRENLIALSGQAERFEAGGCKGLFAFVTELRRLLDRAEEPVLPLPPAADLLEEDYQALLTAVAAHRTRLLARSRDKLEDMTDYYTLWAHQIKTPIAAARLLLQEDPGAVGTEVEVELLKIEQYVDMVLGYLRLDSESTDYVLRDTDLDGLLRQAVRKFARMFILKKITLDFRETGRTVLTDGKWLSFVVEQVLSNALKYTPAGGRIRIYGDGETLVIADSGIGIRPEDLPRVFEKGFTGYNGREDKKSTGIGLYLCRRVMDRLNHGISIVSRPGQGTLVRLDLSRGRRVVE